jgi:putative ABC transport system permease protein
MMQEAIGGITQRPSRSALTALGTAIGIGSFIAVLGVTSSANGQISRDFDAQTATQVSVRALTPAADQLGGVFPVDAEASAETVDGVVGVGSWWDVPVMSVSTLPPYLAEAAEQPRVMAVSPGYWELVAPTATSGRLFDDFLSDQPVAVVGTRLAENLHLGDVAHQPVLYVNGKPVTVIGLVGATERQASPQYSVMVPAAWARAVFGPPGTAETLLVQTEVGAAQVVADQLALAIDPVHPERFAVSPPPAPQVVRDQVSGSIQTLFLALALICLLVGAVGITNATLVGVMSRVPEIGIRRALGARPRHIAAQFLVESGVLGIFGGTVGACAGLLIVIAVAVTQQWTTVIQPLTVIAAPVVGAAVGLLAGLYPALKAARIEPVDAFRG